MKISAVIGANYGDEGKGLITDYLARQTEKPLVIRFNGGAQAGHTVQTKDGTRHVFHHFGSGTLAGAPTYLSKHFIVSPMHFKAEYKELGEKAGLIPNVYAHPDAIVTTPFDVLLNTLVETKRGVMRHGSCGAGIHETVKRSEHPEYRITVSDLFKGEWCDKLDWIFSNYLFDRATELGIWEQAAAVCIGEYVQKLFSQFALDVEFFNNHICTGQTCNFGEFAHLIFEGAQGLLLDQDHKNFPYVTHSHTGLKNVEKIILDMNVDCDNVDAYYVTRPYLTRHGAGPLPGEVQSVHELGVAVFKDYTNVPNEFQGKLRFAPLNVGKLFYEVSKDLWKFNLPVTAKIALTCVDQLKLKDYGSMNIPVVECADSGGLFEVTSYELLDELSNRFKSGLVSLGPTAEHVKTIEEYCGY